MHDGQDGDDKSKTNKIEEIDKTQSKLKNGPIIHH
jgi:hypothetical protein